MTRIQTLIKTFSWRILATGDTFLISWLLTGKLDIAASIASFEFVTKIILYYFHERGWNYSLNKKT